MKGRVTKSFTGPLGTFKKGQIIDITPEIATAFVPSGLVEVIEQEIKTTESKKSATRKTTARKTTRKRTTRKKTK